MNKLLLVRRALTVSAVVATLGAVVLLWRVEAVAAVMVGLALLSLVGISLLDARLIGSERRQRWAHKRRVEERLDVIDAFLDPGKQGDATDSPWQRNSYHEWATVLNRLGRVERALGVENAGSSIVDRNGDDS